MEHMQPPPFPKPVLMSPAVVTALPAPRRRPRPRPGSAALREQPCDSPAPEDTPTRGPRGPQGSSHAGSSVAESGAALPSPLPAAPPPGRRCGWWGLRLCPPPLSVTVPPSRTLPQALSSAFTAERLPRAGQRPRSWPRVQQHVSRPPLTPLPGPQPCSAPKPDHASAPPSSAPLPKLWATVTFSSQLSHLLPPAQGLPSRWRQGSQRKGSMRG